MKTATVFRPKSNLVWGSVALAFDATFIFQTIAYPRANSNLLFDVTFGVVVAIGADRQVGGVDFAHFVGPGLIMMSVITNSYGNVVSSFFGAKFGKHIEELLVSPMPNWVIV